MLNKNGFIIIGDATPFTTPDALDLFKGSGINTFVLYPNEQDHYGAIERLGKAGLNTFIFGGSPLSNVNNKYFPGAIGSFPNFIQKYIDDGVDLNDYKHVGGLYMIDEPGADLFDKINQIYIPWFNLNFADKKIWHVNMLPSYSTPEQLGVGEGDKYYLFEKFINKYADEVLCNVNGVKTVGVDHYPLRKKDGKVFLSDDWLFDLVVTGLTAKRSNAVYSVCIQAYCADGLMSADTAPDITFQLYTAMAFGASMFEFYAYTTAHGNEAMLSDDDKPTNVYYSVREGIRRVKRLENVYLQYEWQGVKCFSPEGKNCVAFDNIAKYQLEKLSEISDVTVSENALISEFSKDNGEKAYLIVNYGIPAISKSNVVQLKTDNAKSLIVYDHGYKEEMQVVDGRATLFLDAGQGVFVIPKY